MKFGSKHIVRFMLLSALAGEFAAAAADVLILRASGPSSRHYPAGRRLPDNASFALRPGDSVVVLAGGTTRTFRGPGTFSAAGPARAGGYAANVQVRRQTGAVRGPGAGEVRRPADVWQADISQSGRICVLPGQRPVLWRPNGERAVQLTITPPSGPAQTVSWAGGQQTMPWPAALPLVGGASYLFSWTGAATPSRITIRTLDGLRANDVAAVATALLDNQCGRQLDVLIATRNSEAGGSGGGSVPR